MGARDTAGAGLHEVCAADLTGVEGGAPLPLAAYNVGLAIELTSAVIEGVKRVVSSL
jgi:hypothetical protein